MTAQETRYETAAQSAARTTKLRRTPFRTAHIFVLPYVIFLLAFGVGPGIYALLVSFSKTVGGRPQLFQAGLSNYVTAFTDFRFGSTIENMLQFLLIALPLGIIGVLLLALLLP